MADIMFGLSSTTEVAKEKKSINLGVGEPHHSLFPINELLEIWNVPKISKYYPPFGDKTLKNQIIQRYYEGIKEESIIITNGGIGALDLIFRAHLRQGDIVLIPNPGFPPYKQMALLQQATVKRYDIALQNSDYLINWNSLESEISPETKFLVINSPHNPTGKVLTLFDEKKLEVLLQQYPKLTIIVDEVYRDIIFNGAKHINLYKYTDRIIVVGSFSKMFPMQGARIGWVMANHDTLAKIKPFVQNCIGAVSSFGQEVAKKLLASNISFYDLYKNNLALATAILDKHKISYILPQGSFYVYIKTLSNSRKVYSDLKDLGVVVIPDEIFGSHTYSYMRVSLSNTQENIQQGIEIICNYLNAHTPATVQASRYMVDFLEKRGIKEIFGVSGANIEDLLFAVKKHSSINIILAKSEYNASTMALGLYLKTKKVQVVFTTSGAGFLNSVPVIAEAHSSRIPMVILSGSVDQSMEGKGAFQDSSGSADTFDMSKVVKPITAYCANVKNADELEMHLENAFAAAQIAKRPAVIFISKNVFNQQVSVSQDKKVENVTPEKTTIHQSLKSVLENSDFILQSVFVFGEECVHIKDESLIYRITEKFKTPVALTAVSKGLFDNTHPQFVGLIGMMGHQQTIEVISAKKNVVFVGCHLNVLNSFGLIPLLKDKRVIIVNEFPSNAEIKVPAEFSHSLSMNVEDFLKYLDNIGLVAESNNLPIAKHTEDKNDNHFSSKNILLTINKMLRQEDHLFVDAGNSGAFAVHYLKPKAKSLFYISLGMGAMGNSMGTAIGASLACKGRSYVFLGDGSFMIHGMEIHTAVENNLPITFFLFNDNAHGMCSLREKIYNHELLEINNFKPATFGNGFKHIFQNLESFEINSLDELNDALAATAGNNKVNLLSLNISREEIPPFKAFINNPNTK